VLNRHQRALALLVAGCFFMEFLDGTIVITAAPRIGEALDVSPSAIGFVITAYLLTLAVLIPLSAWMTQRFGARRVFLAAIALFTLASVGCGLSSGLEMLIGFRVLQGAGGAMMVPVGRLIVLSATDRRDLIKVMSYIVWPALLAPVIAPLAGGLIITYASWRWLFFINIPLGIIAFAVAARLIAPAPATTAPRLDRVGLLVTGTGLAGLAIAAHLLSQPSDPVIPGLALILVSFALLALAVRHLLRTEQPLAARARRRSPARPRCPSRPPGRRGARPAACTIRSPRRCARRSWR
jgi:MFS family permease